ncbi:MAG: hypothetical protein IJM83_04985 [Firmicutes bacterium]|nr:hypothetical protein [Bacillota bacterium]
MSNQVIARPSSGSKQALLKAAILTMSFVQMSTNGVAGADLAANRFIAIAILAVLIGILARIILTKKSKKASSY